MSHNGINAQIFPPWNIISSAVVITVVIQGTIQGANRVLWASRNRFKGDYQVIETVCRLLYMCEGKVLNRVRDQKLGFLIMSMSFSPDEIRMEVHFGSSKFERWLSPKNREFPLLEGIYICVCSSGSRHRSSFSREKKTPDNMVPFVWNLTRLLVWEWSNWRCLSMVASHWQTMSNMSICKVDKKLQAGLHSKS